jgi:hypothetical protein
VEKLLDKSQPAGKRAMGGNLGFLSYLQERAPPTSHADDENTPLLGRHPAF